MPRGSQIGPGMALSSPAGPCLPVTSHSFLLRPLIPSAFLPPSRRFVCCISLCTALPCTKHYPYNPTLCLACCYSRQRSSSASWLSAKTLLQTYPKPRFSASKYRRLISHFSVDSSTRFQGLPFIRPRRHNSASSGDASSSTLSAPSEGTVDIDGKRGGDIGDGSPKRKTLTKKMPFRQRMARHFGDSVRTTSVASIMTAHRESHHHRLELRKGSSLMPDSHSWGAIASNFTRHAFFLF